MASYDIYGIGNALVDTEIEVSDDDLQQMGVAKGLMTLVDEKRQSELLQHLEGHIVTARRASGGSGANAVIAASYFGARSFYSCKVAADDNGSFYLDDMRAAGVGVKTVELESGISGKCLVLITPDAERSMNTYLGISEFLSDRELDEDALAASQFLYIEGYVVTSPTGRAAAVRAREVAEARGVKTSISLSDPTMVSFFRQGLEEMIGGGVDLLFCNRDEALGWSESEDLESAAEALKSVARTFAITLGAEGALIYDGESLFHSEAHAVEAVDSNGAGDMFAGAFLYAVSQGRSYREAARLACRSASEVVAHFGPRLRAEAHPELLKEAGL